jgi:hypothetical protein
MKKNTIYRFKRTEDYVMVLNSEAEVIFPHKKEEHEAVIYQNLETKQIYVREKSDFKRKFEEVEQ